MLLDEINKSMANKFHLHLQKYTELRIFFTRDDVSYEDVSIDQTTLSIVEWVKILGVTIQNNLKWNLQTKDTIKKASKILYFLKQLKRAKLSTDELIICSFMPHAFNLLFFTHVKSANTVLRNTWASH